MLRRFQAAATYWIGTAPQTLTLLLMVGALSCLTVPNLALSTSDNPAKGTGGCPPTKTGDPAPCVAKDGTQVVTTTDSTPPPDSAPKDKPAAGGDTAVAGAPGPTGPDPVSSTPPATADKPATAPQPAPDTTPAPAADTTTTDTTPAPDAPKPADPTPVSTTPTAPPPAPKPTPSKVPATRLGKPRIEAWIVPRGNAPSPQSHAREVISDLPAGGGVSGTAPSLPITSPLAPGPSSGPVPNVLLDHFPIPPFLLPLYQAAGIEYNVPWQVLAAINEIETDYGRNLSVSSAGAQGWMQFMPSSWQAYGVDANGDGRKDPYNPADAIFAAARYLKAAGGDKDIRQAIYSYNHAWWYVDSVMLRAKLVRALPGDLVASLSGLTQGRIPVGGPARWIKVRRDVHKRNPKLVVEAAPAAPVVAVNDAQVIKRGLSRKLGAYLTLRDAYGNTYTYSQLGSVAREYAALRPTALTPPTTKAAPADPRPRVPASAGAQHPSTVTSLTSPAAAAATSRPVVAKERLFAHPARPASYSAGGSRQVGELTSAEPAPTARVSEYFTGPVRFTRSDLVLRPLRAGARVIAGTVLGRVGPAQPGSVLSKIEFETRPAGAPAVDPKPFVNGWHLLAASGVYGGAGTGALKVNTMRRATIGQILLMSKDQLTQLVLNDPRIRIYDCGRQDIASGQIDRRVLATLAYLAASGLDPLVSALKCGHSFYTTAGTVSEHSYGSAVDVASINGTAILGHQGQGSITDVTIRRLLQLQGTMKPHQIISLMTFPGADNTLAMGDHADHIHIGFSPGGIAGPGGLPAILAPGQWTRLVNRLGEIENPTLAAVGHAARR